MSLPGGHPGFPVVHVPACYEEGRCTLLRPGARAWGENDEEVRAFMARREPWRSDPAWWAHDAVCLCEPCARARGDR